MSIQNKEQTIRELEEAIELGRKVFYCLKRAEEKLDKASDWGLVDLAVPNFITANLKHRRIQEANLEIERARYYLGAFRKGLDRVVFPKDISVHVGQVTRLADILLASRVMDVFVQDKINDTCEQLEKSRKQIKRVVQELQKMKQLEEREVILD